MPTAGERPTPALLTGVADGNRRGVSPPGRVGEPETGASTPRGCGGPCLIGAYLAGEATASPTAEHVRR